MEKHKMAAPLKSNPDGSINFEKVDFWNKPTEEIIKEVHPKREDIWEGDPTATPVSVMEMEEEEKRFAAIRAGGEKERVRKEHFLREEEQKKGLYERITRFFDSKK